MSTDHLTTPLLAIAVPLLLLGRWGHSHVTGPVRKGVWGALRCYPALNNRRAYRRLTASRDGLAVVLLLLNAAAKSHPELYEHKVLLLRAIVAASRDDEWWVEQHDHPQATDYQGTCVVFVETTIGPILSDVPRVQLAAHISADDAASHFPNTPAANGRSWSGISLQPHAEEIAKAFIRR